MFPPNSRCLFLLAMFLGLFAQAGHAARELPFLDASRIVLSVNGAKQGLFDSGQNLVLNVSHEIVIPTDPASGLPTGRRLHKPITLLKLIDGSTPLLMNALVTNENLTEVKISFIGQSPTNPAQTNAGFVIKLTDANVTSFIHRPPDTLSANVLAALLKGFQRTGNIQEVEEVSFTYREIEYIYGNAVARDDVGSNLP